MTESIITILIIGFCAGFLFSMPVAGPISILITSNALQGRYRYCVRAALGAAVGEIGYIFMAVYGIAMFYQVYRPCMPYFLLLGAVFLIFIGVKIARTPLYLNQLDRHQTLTDKLQNKGGLRTGFFMVITNLSLIVGWLTSSFLVFSVASAIGLKTGGLDIWICHNVQSISKLAAHEIGSMSALKQSLATSGKQTAQHVSMMSKMVLSVLYSIAVAIGIFTWFFVFTRFLVKNRQRLRVTVLSRVIHILGYVLGGIGIYLAVEGLHFLL